MTPDAPDTTVFELGALFDLEPAYAAVTQAVVAAYGALPGGPPAARELAAAACAGAEPVARAAAILVARAGGVPAAVAVARVERLALEHLLGTPLHEAVTGRAAVDVTGPGALADVRLRSGADARLEAARGGRRALVGRLPTPALLFLLARCGLTDAFDHVVGADAEAITPPPLVALVAEVARRLGPVARVVVAHPADAASASLLAVSVVDAAALGR